MFRDLEPEKLSGYARFLYDTVEQYRADEEKLRRAAFATWGNVSDAPSNIQTRLRSIVRSARDLTFAFAVERVGRDISDLKGELLRCFKKRGRHKRETLLRRLLAEPNVYLPYQIDRYIDAALDELRREGKVYTERGRGYQTLWLLVTQERQAQREADEQERARQEAADAAEEARQEAVIEKLHQLGCKSAHAHSWTSTEVTIRVADIEALLADLENIEGDLDGLLPSS
jgi:hypothetical protein